MNRAWILALAAACGRENFDDAPDTGTGIVLDNGDNDGDGVINASDNCPAHFNQTQLDGDGDHVGDACDPRPAIPGDRLVAVGLFSSGYGAWVPDAAANWLATAIGVQTTTMQVDGTQARISLATAASQPTVQIGFTIDNYGGLFSEILRVRLASGSDDWDCVAYGSTSRIDQALLNRFSSQADGRSIPSIAVGSTASLTINEWTAGVGCIVNGVVAMSTTMPSLEANIIATIEVNGLQATIAYAALYSID